MVHQVFHLIVHPFHFCSPNYQTDEAKLFQVNVVNSCDFKSIVPSFLSKQFDPQLSSGMNIENACTITIAWCGSMQSDEYMKRDSPRRKISWQRRIWSNGNRRERRGERAFSFSRRRRT